MRVRRSKVQFSWRICCGCCRRTRRRFQLRSWPLIDALNYFVRQSIRFKLRIHWNILMETKFQLLIGVDFTGRGFVFLRLFIQDLFFLYQQFKQNIMIQCLFTWLFKFGNCYCRLLVYIQIEGNTVSWRSSFRLLLKTRYSTQRNLLMLTACSLLVSSQDSSISFNILNTSQLYPAVVFPLDWSTVTLSSVCVIIIIIYKYLYVRICKKYIHFFAAACLFIFTFTFDRILLIDRCYRIMFFVIASYD